METSLPPNSHVMFLADRKPEVGFSLVYSRPGSCWLSVCQNFHGKSQVIPKPHSHKLGKNFQNPFQIKENRFLTFCFKERRKYLRKKAKRIKSWTLKIISWISQTKKKKQTLISTHVNILYLYSAHSIRKGKLTVLLTMWLASEPSEVLMSVCYTFKSIVEEILSSYSPQFTSSMRCLEILLICGVIDISLFPTSYLIPFFFISWP